MKSKIKITYRDKDGNTIIDPTENEVAYSPETKQLYKFTNNEWKMIKPEGGLNFSVYDLNKQIVAQMENIEINEDAMLEAKQTIQAFGHNKENYYFILSHLRPSSAALSAKLQYSAHFSWYSSGSF